MLSSRSLRPAAALGALVLLVAACSGSGGVPGSSGSTTSPASTTSAPVTTSTAPAPVLCSQAEFRPAATVEEVRSVPADDPAAAALGFSRDVFACAAAGRGGLAR